MLGEGRHIFGRRPKPRAAKLREKLFAFRAGHYEHLVETGNRAKKVSGTQGSGGGVAKCRLFSQATFLHDYFSSYDHAIFGHKIFLILTRND